MNNRQDLPLSLIAAIEDDSIEGRTRLQKLLFLVQKKAESGSGEPIDNGYEFVAYDYGPFAKEIYDDIDRLIRRNIVSEVPKELDDGVIKYNYELTEKGEKIVEERDLLEDAPDEIKTVVEEFNDKELSEIIDFVYSQYPEYAENSLIG